MWMDVAVPSHLLSYICYFYFSINLIKIDFPSKIDFFLFWYLYCNQIVSGFSMHCIPANATLVYSNVSSVL